MKLLETKRKEANARTLARSKLTPKQQIAKLDARGATATRERRRLTSTPKTVSS